MNFKDFVHNYVLKNKTTSKIEFFLVFSSLPLYDVGIYLRDRPFKSDKGIINLHPNRGSHFVLYVRECYFDSYGCPPTQTLSKFNIKQKKTLFIYQIQNTRVDK